MRKSAVMGSSKLKTAGCLVQIESFYVSPLGIIDANPNKISRLAIQNIQNDTPSNSGCAVRIVPLHVLAFPL